MFEEKDGIPVDQLGQRMKLVALGRILVLTLMAISTFATFSGQLRGPTPQMILFTIVSIIAARGLGETQTPLVQLLVEVLPYSEAAIRIAEEARALLPPEVREQVRFLNLVEEPEVRWADVEGAHAVLIGNGHITRGPQSPVRQSVHSMITQMSPLFVTNPTP